MTNADISQVKRVMETDDPGQVNKRLAEGWILLNVYSRSYPSDYGPTQQATYVLGWAQASPAPN
jgi:hypothetical protein